MSSVFALKLNTLKLRVKVKMLKISELIRFFYYLTILIFKVMTITSITIISSTVKIF